MKHPSNQYNRFSSHLWVLSALGFKGTMVMKGVCKRVTSIQFPHLRLTDTERDWLDTRHTTFMNVQFGRN